MNITLSALLAALRDQSAEARQLVERAWHFSLHAHEGQTRLSGEPYFEAHVARVAYSLAEAGMDTETVAAGLLHDILEDTPTSREEIEREFGNTVTFLVDGVTKLGKLKYRGLERHVESLRRLLVATASDIRVIIIKLYDRLHNMETNRFHPPDRQKRKALETMEVYVPIAERLGIGSIKTHLEDLAFQTLEPEQYKQSYEFLRGKERELTHPLEEDMKDLKTALAEAGMRSFTTEYRFKSVYSFHKKLARKGGEVERVYDIIALRVIVESVDECYRALGIIHSVWRPIPGRVKDYIAFPKPNGYRSLHTTVITRRGTTIEVQLRTRDMHRDAEFGVASHFNYKSGASGSSAGWLANLMPSLLKTKTASAGYEAPRWLKELTTLEQEHKDFEAFEEMLKNDFFAERMFVFTPKGDVIDLPRGATPVDFAYAIHSGVGDRMTGAKVNGKLVALDTELANGSVVEIITKREGAPNKKWLEYAKTASAKAHIRSGLKRGALH